MERKFHVFENGQHGQHEYTIIDKPTKNGRKISLFFSDGEQWVKSSRNSLILVMTVTGNDVRFTKNTKILKFDELCEMRLLMNYENKTSNKLNRVKSLLYEVTKDSTNNKIMKL